MFFGVGGIVCNFVPLAVPLTVHYVSISQSLSKHTFWPSVGGSSCTYVYLCDL